MPPFDPKTASLDELAQWTGQSQPGSDVHTRGSAELTRRQLHSEMEATGAAKRNANYMLASVMIAAIAAIASAVSALATVHPAWFK
jgi:hypothetical protein